MGKHNRLTGKHRKISVVHSTLEGVDAAFAQPPEDLSEVDVVQAYDLNRHARTVFCSQPGELFGDPDARISASEIETICYGVKQLLTTHFGTDRDGLLADWRSWRDRPHHLRLSNPLMRVSHKIGETGTFATLGVSVHTDRHASCTKTVYVHCFDPDAEDGRAMAWITRQYVEEDWDPDFGTTNTRSLSLTSDNPVRAGQAAVAFNFARLSLGQRDGAYSNIPRLGEGEYYLGIAALGLPLIGETS